MKRILLIILLIPLGDSLSAQQLDWTNRPTLTGVNTVAPQIGNIQAAIAAAGNNSNVELTTGAIYSITSKLVIQTTGLTLDCKGATLSCGVSMDHCIELSNPPGSPYFSQSNKILNCRLTPTSQSTGSAIHDAAWNTTIENLSWAANGSNYFTNGVQVDNDESFIVRGMASPAGVLRCDSFYCGSAIYNPAGSGNAAVGWISDSNLSMGCQGNPINWQGGNDLYLSGTILQAFSEYGLSFAATATGADSMVLASKVHVEQGNCLNPGLNNINAGAAYIMNGGALHSDSGQLVGTMPQFPVTGVGATNYAYYVMATDSMHGYTAPLPVGYVTNGPSAFASGTSQITVTFPTIPSATSCDLLRVNQTSAGRVAPYGTGKFAVATGLTCNNGTFVQYIDSNNTPLPYTIPYNGSYMPTLPLWVGSVVLTAAGSTNGYALARYSGTCPPGTIFVAVESAPGFNPPVFCEGSTEDDYSGDKMPYGTAAISRTNGYIPNVGPSAFLIPGQFFYANKLNLKGVINLGVNPFIQHGPTDLITIADSNSEKTGATPGNRPAADANDTAIGIDGTHDGFGVRSKTSISQYIGNRFDGASWLERLTSTSKTFAVPIKASSYAGMGAVSFTAGTAAGRSPGIPACAVSHICDSFSGTLSFTVGTSTSTGALLTVTMGATRMSLPTCTGRAYLIASPYTELPVRLTYTNSTIVFNVGTAPMPTNAYELVYAACGGN